ncbi:unnamed protein product [Ranitomeya imitator]|uniref:Uncharacterized protein n=1 Tax=Ranitomeya imitator TaxID=111125 RepID=A0ABN9KV15_9NEOB|nr:unnamed protein product [Ranitomeya imitator]
MLFYSTKSFWPNVAERNLPSYKEEHSDFALDSSKNENCAGNEMDPEKNGEISPLSDESHHTSVSSKTGASVESEEADSAPDHHRNKNLRSTMNLLLLRGADPNICSIPMLALFFAVKAADVSAVWLLLECGARTDVRVKTQHGSLTPLHIAAALPVVEGIRITEILLHAAADPNASAEDEDFVYDHDRGEMSGALLGFSMKGGLESGLPLYSYFDKSPCVSEEGGRTPLHVACEREDNYKYARDTISLLLAHKAKINPLWSGHSPLSLAIASGNDLAVKELLANGADPNLALSRGVGSALCAAVNIDYEKKRTLAARIGLVRLNIHLGDVLKDLSTTWTAPCLDEATTALTSLMEGTVKQPLIGHREPRESQCRHRWNRASTGDLLVKMYFVHGTMKMKKRIVIFDDKETLSQL